MQPWPWKKCHNFLIFSPVVKTGEGTIKDYQYKTRKKKKQTVCQPNNGQHKWLDAGGPQVFTGLVHLHLQDVLHDEDDVLYQQGVLVLHDHLEIKLTTSQHPVNEGKIKISHSNITAIEVMNNTQNNTFCSSHSCCWHPKKSWKQKNWKSCTKHSKSH